MKVFSFVLAAMFALVSCSHTPPQSPSGSDGKAEWIRASDNIANEYTKEYAAIIPEIGSEIGLTEFDSQGIRFDNTFDQRTLGFQKRWVERLNREASKSYPAQTLEDIQILKEKVQIEIDYAETEQKIGVVEFWPGTRSIFMNLQQLLMPQNPAERKAAAVDRFKQYVNGHGQYKPVLEASQEYFKWKQKNYSGDKKIYSYKGEIETYLRDSASFVQGIGEILKTSGRTDWTDDYEKFKKQAAGYDEFVKKEVLPLGRPTAQLPRALYAIRLKVTGFNSSPEEIRNLGLNGYKQLYPEYQKLAKSLAKKHKLKSSAPRDVIAFLKKNQVTESKDVEQLYQDADQRLKEIVNTNNLVTLPTIPLVIRLAGEAESKAQPVPHLNSPPFINNKGERPEFVVPTAKGKLPYDDFSYRDAAIVLTAHEGRPGHDLQFSRMLEGGMSTVRATYAMNSVNVEGWALYAEDLVYPYLKDEEKMVGLQMRLWRMARAFLDPQIQLGEIKDQKVYDVFTKELGVSKEMAKQELDRYKFRSPGQAPAYYYGYTIMKKARAEAEKKAGTNFNLKCFNDEVLSYGMLPLEMIVEKVSKSTACLPSQNTAVKTR